MDSNNLPFFERPDLSPFLVHLTKNTNSKNKHSAFENLVSILKTGLIWGTGKKGYVRGPNKAACFMDIPIGSLKYVLNARNTKLNKPRYEPYGIVVSKEFAYKQGCRPVLYLSKPETEQLNIPIQELWRVVTFGGMGKSSINWIHEREWRAKDEFRLPSTLRAVLVKNAKEAKKLQQLIETSQGDFQVTPSSIIPLTVLCQGLPYL